MSSGAVARSTCPSPPKHQSAPLRPSQPSSSSTTTHRLRTRSSPPTTAARGPQTSQIRSSPACSCASCSPRTPPTTPDTRSESSSRARCSSLAPPPHKSKPCAAGNRPKASKYMPASLRALAPTLSARLCRLRASPPCARITSFRDSRPSMPPTRLPLSRALPLHSRPAPTPQPCQTPQATMKQRRNPSPNHPRGRQPKASVSARTGQTSAVGLQRPQVARNFR
eukprot:2357747-Pleurochrysis_carterae.AAC.2